MQPMSNQADVEIFKRIRSGGTPVVEMDELERKHFMKTLVVFKSYRWVDFILIVICDLEIML